MPVTRTGDTYVVETQQTVRFSVTIVDDLKEAEPLLLVGHGRTTRRVVVMDGTVEELYGKAIRTCLDRLGVEIVPIVMALDERSKELGAVERLATDFYKLRVSRDEPVIAIGGGVLTDVVGCAAAVFRRGVSWVRIVTTGQMIDAGCSPKTAVNLIGGKSVIGAFHPPLSTVVPRAYLRTVGAPQLRDMMSEAVKAAIMRDAALLDLIEQWGETLVREKLQGGTRATDEAAREFLHRSVYATVDDNADNLWEQDQRRRMYFGHTWGPAIEMGSLHGVSPLLHGQGVAIDMALSMVLAERRGLVSVADRDRVLALLRALDLPVWHPLACDVELMKRATAGAQAARNGELLAPLPTEIGAAEDVEFVSDIRGAEIAAAASWLRAWSA